MTIAPGAVDLAGRQAAVTDASRRLYDAEIALHIVGGDEGLDGEVVEHAKTIDPTAAPRSDAIRQA